MGARSARALRLWGLLFGALMDLWFWPFAIGPDTQHWQAGVGLGETLKRFAAFYVATSFLWDSIRAVGTIAMLLLFGSPTLRTFRRCQALCFHGGHPALGSSRIRSPFGRGMPDAPRRMVHLDWCGCSGSPGDS